MKINRVVDSSHAIYDRIEMNGICFGGLNLKNESLTVSYDRYYENNFNINGSTNGMNNNRLNRCNRLNRYNQLFNYDDISFYGDNRLNRYNDGNIQYEVEKIEAFKVNSNCPRRSER